MGLRASVSLLTNQDSRTKVGVSANPTQAEKNDGNLKKSKEHSRTRSELDTSAILAVE